MAYRSWIADANSIVFHSYTPKLAEKRTLQCKNPVHVSNVSLHRQAAYYLFGMCLIEAGALPNRSLLLLLKSKPLRLRFGT